MRNYKISVNQPLKTIGIVFRLFTLCLTLTMAACASLPFGLSNTNSRAHSSQPMAVALLDANTLRLGQVLISGTLESISANEIVVNNLPIRIDNLTVIPAGIKPGSQAKVLAIRLPDKTHYAIEIAIMNNGNDSQMASAKNQNSSKQDSGEFRYLGIVQQTGKGSWNISGLAIEVDENTTIDSRIKSGNVAHVEGSIINGIFVANKIEYDELTEDKTTTPEFGNPGAATPTKNENEYSNSLTPTVLEQDSEQNDMNQKYSTSTPAPSNSENEDSSQQHPETSQNNKGDGKGHEPEGSHD